MLAPNKVKVKSFQSAVDAHTGCERGVLFTTLQSNLNWVSKRVTEMTTKNKNFSTGS